MSNYRMSKGTTEHFTSLEEMRTAWGMKPVTKKTSDRKKLKEQQERFLSKHKCKACGTPMTYIHGNVKVSERTREDGSSIGNALKTIITRTTKVGKMPQYADEVDNATLSNASASLHAIGVDVYNPDGSDRGIITVMSELKDKWDDLTDAQQAKIAFDVAATRLKASLCMKKFILE